MILFEQIVNDPTNTIIAAILFGIVILFLRYAVPWLRKTFTQFLGEKNYSLLYGLIIQAAQAAEQARRKGELDILLKGLGLKLPVNLSDGEKCKEYVIAFVQQQLLNFSWGHLVNASTIYTLLLSALRQDAHKGATSPIDEIHGATPEQLMQVLSPEQIEITAQYAARAKVVGQGVALASGPLPSGRRSKH